jgi:hypothetical protein
LLHKDGADAVYDYGSSGCFGKIQKAYPSITKALDCYSKGTSTAFSGDVLQEGGKMVTLLDQGKSNKPNVSYTFLMVSTIFSRKFQMLSPLGPVFPVMSTDHEVISNFYRNLSTISLRHPPITTIMGKFSEIFEGLDTLRKGEGRGTKLVIEFQ